MLGFLALAQEALARIRDRLYSPAGTLQVTIASGTARAALASGQVASCDVAAPGVAETVAAASIDLGIS